MGRRAFVLSIDSATLDVVRPLAEQGRMPNLARLMEQGSWGPLRSTIQPITPAAWVSFMTGMNPGRHGIYDFTEREQGSYVRRLLGRKDFRAAPLWVVASAQDYKTIVMNVPFTYPPDPVNGHMMSGFDAPVIDDSVFHPSGLRQEIEKEVGPFLPDWTFPTGRSLDLDAYMKDVRAAMKYRTDLALHLMQKHPWDFFMVHYQSIDHVQHVFWNDAMLDRMYEAHEVIDTHVGRLLEKIDEDTNLFVISDHGAGPIKKFVFLGQWLQTEGFLGRREKGFSPTKTLSGAARLTEKTLKKMLPFKIRGALRRAMPGLRDKVSSLGMAGDIDWSKTRAYAQGMYGNLNVNLRGREPQGIVDPAHYESTREQLIEAVHRLRDPDTGEEIVDKVWRREDLYEGSEVERAPDLLIQWKDYAYYTELRYDQGRETIFGEPGTIFFDSSEYAHTGTHRQNGILVARGPDIRPADDVAELRLMDMAPTILYLMGAGIPEDMDGQVLKQLIREETLGQITERRVPSLGGLGTPAAPEVSDEDRKAMEERLRGLGYLE